MMRHYLRYLATGCVLAYFAACTAADEADEHEVPSVPSEQSNVEERLSGSFTIRYKSEDDNTLEVTAAMLTSTRPLILGLSMPMSGDQAIPAAALDRLRADGTLEITIVEGLDQWVVRGNGNELEALTLSELAHFYDTAPSFTTICGSAIAKARVTLSASEERFQARISVLDPWQPYAFYEDLHGSCEVIVDSWFWGQYHCQQITPGIQCTAIVDCGTILGGTRRCAGDCRVKHGFWGRYCMCEISESLCCNAPTQPTGPSVKAVEWGGTQ